MGGAKITGQNDTRREFPQAKSDVKDESFSCFLFPPLMIEFGLTDGRFYRPDELSCSTSQCRRHKTVFDCADRWLCRSVLS